MKSLKKEGFMGTPKKDSRLEEIEDIYRQAGLLSEESREYFTYLRHCSEQEEMERTAIFIEAGTNSNLGEWTNARLESASE